MAHHWGLMVVLGGADVSARLTGEVTIKRAKNAAAVAEFTVIPAAGAFDLNTYTNKPVTIDYRLYDAAGALLGSYRRYTGRVNDPQYDAVTRRLRFVCTDQYQERLEKMTRAEIDTLIGGYFSEHIYNDPDNNYDYAQRRRSTLPSDLNLSLGGNFVLAGWNPKSTPDYTFDGDTILGPPSAEPIGITSLQARNVKNKVTITLSAQYERLWHRIYTLNWVDPYIPALNNITWGDFLGNIHNLPAKSSILEAINSEWSLKSLSMTHPPRNDLYDAHSRDGATFQSGWINKETLRTETKSGADVGDKEGVVDFQLEVFKRWKQSVTERYTLTVQSQSSIAVFEEQPDTVEYTVSVEDSAYPDWETAVDNESVTAVTSWDDYIATLGGAQQNQSRPISTGITNNKYPAAVPGWTALGVYGDDFVVLDADTAAIDNALLTAMHDAKRQILESHRIDGCRFSLLVDAAPGLDVDNTVAATVTELNYVGKVSALDDRYTFEAAGRQPQAVMTVTLSMYAPSMGGQTDDAIAVPSDPYADPSVALRHIELETHIGTKSYLNGVPEADFSLPDDPAWTGLVTNYWANLGYPTYGTGTAYDTRVAIEIPAVSEADRDEVIYSGAQTINVAIPQNTTVIVS